MHASNATDVSPIRLLGVDFTSAPTRRKPITAAWGRFLAPDLVGLDRIDRCPDLASFEAMLRTPGPWVGAFDFPFGLPRPLVEALGWPQQWPALIEHYAALSRADIRELFRAYCAARPAGAKFAHRATDRLARSSPSMKWVNPPVAWMLHAGAPRLLRSGVRIPGLCDGAADRVALEGYPALLARSATRASYKSDSRSGQTVRRRAARADVIDAVAAGFPGLGLRLRLTPAWHVALLEDARADLLDAVLCLLQSAWAARRAGTWGLPGAIDPVEGWIVTAGHVTG